ncbi:MAG: type II secretion system inner membrane protein GspF [Wenzhouxiangella sp.]
MQAYEYQALTDKGASARGVIQADSARAARGQLRERGLIPLEVRPVGVESRFGSGLVRYGRERALLLRQLSTLLTAGLPLEEVLSVLVEQSDNAAIRRRLGAIRARVMEGQSLSAAMSGQEALFPGLYTAAISAGERAGRLEAVLGRLADHAEQREAMRRSFSLALIYPLLLIAVAIAVVWGLIGFVVPRVMSVFEQAAQELPMLTRSLLALSDFIATYGLWVLVVVAVGTALFVLALRRPAFRWRVDRALLSLPLAGRLIRAQQTATFTRTLAILTSSAVPLVEAMQVAARVVGNRVARGDIESAAGQVREGVSLSRAVEACDWLPPTVRRLIAGGERSGELAAMLEHAAEIQESELQAASAAMLAVLQPALVLLVGAVVLYIVLAIMLPIMSMSQLLA